MNSIVHEFVNDITNNAPTGNKLSVINYIQSKYNLARDGKVYHNKFFAVRFSFSQKGAFPNTVLALARLQKYDNIPFFSVLVRGNGPNLIYLSNSTFLSKISHSSQNLTMTNIRGSFNGSDIIKSYDGLGNCPENFDILFGIHQGMEWEDNLLRLVDASSSIVPVSLKFIPTEKQKKNLYASVKRALDFISSPDYQTLLDDLNDRCRKCEKEISIVSGIDNTNIRGRLIESMISSSDRSRDRIKEFINSTPPVIPEFSTRDELGDYTRTFESASTYTDIKTKLLYRSSAPKAYNIDKFLERMSEDNSVFLFYFIGIDNDGKTSTALCSVFHDQLIDASAIQPHWAGRATRGVVQFKGNTVNDILSQKSFTNKIDAEKARRFLELLLNK